MSRAPISRFGRPALCLKNFYFHHLLRQPEKTFHPIIIAWISPVLLLTSTTPPLRTFSLHSPPPRSMFSRQISKHCAQAALRTARPVRAARSIVYVKSISQQPLPNNAKPLRPNVGLKKAPETFLSANGTLYPGNEATLAKVKSLLGADYALPDDLILQVLTHKSFSHGLKPYNQNLAIIGKHFLRLETTSYAVKQESANPSAINGINFDVCLSKISNLLSATAATSQLCKNTGIAESIFWKAPKVGDKSNTVYATTINALVGAVLLKRGQHAARSFVNEKLLAGEHSLITIAEKVYK